MLFRLALASALLSHEAIPYEIDEDSFFERTEDEHIEEQVEDGNEDAALEGIEEGLEERIAEDDDDKNDENKYAPASQEAELGGDDEHDEDEEGEAEAAALKEYFEWCDDVNKNTGFEIKSVQSRKDKVEAKISELNGEIQADSSKIDDLASEVSANTKGVEAAAATRSKEEKEFSAAEEELAEGVNTLGRVIGILSKESAKSPAALAEVAASQGIAGVLHSMSAVIDAAAFSVADKQRLAVMVQTQQSALDEDAELGAPAAANYKSKNGSIIDVLNDMKEKAEGDATAGRIQLKMKGKRGKEMQFKIKERTPLRMMMDAYCSLHGLQAWQVRFLIDGERIAPNHTAEKLGLKDEDIIDVRMEQIGGGRHQDPLPGHWTSEKITRRICSFGRYVEKRPRGLGVVQGGMLLDELVRHWGEEQLISRREIVAAVRKHERHEDGSHRFKVEDDGHGNVVINVMEKRSAQEAEPSNRREAKRTNEARETVQRSVQETEQTIHSEEPQQQFPNGWQWNGYNWLAPSSSSWQQPPAVPEQAAAAAASSSAKREEAKEVVLRSAQQVEQTARPSKRPCTDTREADEEAVAEAAEENTPIKLDREKIRQQYRQRAATFWAQREARLKAEEETRIKAEQDEAQRIIEEEARIKAEQDATAKANADEEAAAAARSSARKIAKIGKGKSSVPAASRSSNSDVD